VEKKLRRLLEELPNLTGAEQEALHAAASSQGKAARRRGALRRFRGKTARVSCGIRPSKVRGGT
jgi:hypothetical protein